MKFLFTLPLLSLLLSLPNAGCSDQSSPSPSPTTQDNPAPGLPSGPSPPTEKKKTEKKDTSLRVKSLADFAREASILHTIAYDEKLVKAMRNSNAVRALVIGILMSRIYKREYWKLYNSMSKDEHTTGSVLKLNVAELDEELRYQVVQFFGQLRDMVAHSWP